MFNKCRKTTAKPPINVKSISTFNKVNIGLRINFFSIRKEPIPMENIYNPTVTLYLKTVFSRKADKDWASNNSYIMLQKAKTKVIVKRMAKILLTLFKNKKPGSQDQVKYIGYALPCHSRVFLSGIQNQNSPWIPEKLVLVKTGIPSGMTFWD